MMRADPTERACLLMAEIEEGEHGDQGRVRAWLTRALTALRDPAWVADGEVFEHWAPVSPVSGRIDAFEWKVPTDRLPPRQAMEIDGLARPEPIAQESAQPTSAAPSVPAAAPTWSAVANTAAPPSILAPATPSGAGVRTAKVAPAALPRPMARAPDDPGPHLPGEEDDSSGLPMFHPGRMA
jgi:HemY protein